MTKRHDGSQLSSQSQGDDSDTEPLRRRRATEPGTPERPPVPWHFKLIVVAAAVYIALRIVQMLGWIGVGVKDLHNALALLLIALNGAVGLWGVLAWWRGWTLIRGFMYLALLGWWGYLPQVALGIALYSGGHRAPTGWQHYIYGIGAALGIGVGSFYRRRLPGREGMLYGLVCLFLMGVAVRAFMTGHG
jgi:hypothetical protein